MLTGRTAQRITNETYRWVSDARLHPSGSKVVATKWYTSQRSLGAGEAWEYELPGEDGAAPATITSGSGKRLIGRKLPPGWKVEDYSEQQIGPEQFIWNGEDGLIYSENVVDQDAFSYSKGTALSTASNVTLLTPIQPDVHKGIYAIFAKNLITGRTEQLVSETPGGASRPELSHDRQTLAFVRRVRDKEVLVLKYVQEPHLK